MSIEDVLIAISEQVGGLNIKSVVLSNVPPFIKEKTLKEILERYGKLTAPIKMIPLGLKNPNFKHVMSFRRFTYMIPNSQNELLNLVLKIAVEGKDYTIFVTSDNMRCFLCSEYGHQKQACPKQQSANNSAGSQTSPKINVQENNVGVKENNAAVQEKNEDVQENNASLYSTREISAFLDETKGVRNPQFDLFFPDLKRFLVSCRAVMINATVEELSRQKRYCLKKIITKVKKMIHQDMKKSSC
uniref:CCHC-type domain-containing protein n=1 Tax=Cyprinus carpio carpio TaxID=630221 RepID=A0A9J8DN12_CYPCA